MATTGVGFRWLDILEKDFDKACVELDTSLVELEAEEPEAMFGARQKIATLSSCFAQLTHKALTIFQNSAKLEAELVDMRAELVQARAAASGNTQCAGESAGVSEAALARCEAAQLARENAALRDTVLALHSELFGARLATKYLDKELAGRIQQLQLLGRDMRADIKDSLWAQVEAEILLQRHKTLVRVCRGLSPRPPRPPPEPRARPRTVRVRRSPHQGLGISVTGGREHGVPILISELEAGGPAALTGALYVGDAILAINDLDLTQACHKEAVQALQSVKGDCALCVQFIATDDDDRLSEDNYRFPLYPESGEPFEPDGSGATPTAPRTPDYHHRPRSVSHSGSESECGRYPPPAPLDAALVAPLPAQYPDYNSINNNLAILDMDDDSIKIEARLEVVSLESPVSPLCPRRGPYRALPASSADSPHSTPVHSRRTHKKKRKPDWRAKGAYRPVADEHSSDEVFEKAQDRSVETQTAPAAPSQLPAPPTTEVSPGITPSIIPTINPGVAPVEAPALPAVAPAAPVDVTDVKINGDIKLGHRRETKPFRIGTARRVTDNLPNHVHDRPITNHAPNFRVSLLSHASLSNTSNTNYAPAPLLNHGPLTNGDVEKSKFPVCLLTGDGDPDFGTPV